MDEERGAEPAKDGDGFSRPLGGIGRDSDIESLALLDGGVQRPQRFFERGVRVEAVMVEDVDVVDAQPLQALVQAGQEILSRAEVTVRAGPHIPPGFC